MSLGRSQRRRVRSHRGARAAAAPGGGLPFAGIPSELQEGVDKLLAERARAPRAGRSRFTLPRPADDRAAHLTLRGLIFRHWRLGAAAGGARHDRQRRQPGGPKLIDIGINSGMTGAHKSFGVVAARRGRCSCSRSRSPRWPSAPRPR